MSLATKNMPGRRLIQWISDSALLRSPSLLIALFAVLIGIMFLTAEALKYYAVRRDLQQLQGDWVLVSSEILNAPEPPDVVRTYRRTITDNTYVIYRRDRNGLQVIRGVITLDPSQTPKAVDVILTEGPGKGSKLLGIYKIEGDLHTVCVKQAGERPTDFDSGQGSVLVWTRARE
jgi:uncharacterized protein (TIGR03067 family)